MRAFLFPIVVVSGGLLGGSAAAEPAYTAKDIVNHFAPLGASRDICIGTEAKCGSGEADTPAVPVQNFDLLIAFDLDSATLTAEAKERLDQFAEALRNARLAGASFAVEGHTDARGGERYNLSLSEQRAKAVIEYLQSQGVDTAKLTARGLGKAHPRTPNPFDAENRRVEARLLQ